MLGAEKWSYGVILYLGNTIIQNTILRIGQHLRTDPFMLIPAYMAHSIKRSSDCRFSKAE